MAFPIGAAIGAGASILGGVLGSRNASADRRAQMRINQQNIDFQKDTNRQNRKLQMKTNKRQIQWLVSDARKAGINPLAALGSSAAGNIGAPTMVAPELGGLPSSGNAIGDGIARGAAVMGQGIDQWLARENVALQNEAISLANARSRTMMSQARADENNAPVLKAFGLDIQRDASKFSSAQALTDEYGEGADFVGGVSGLHSARKALAAKGVPFLGDGEDLVLNAIRSVLNAYSRQLQPGQSVGKGRYNK